MAIIIPSKDIYEINNQKVVDNEVDNIETSAKNVVLEEEFNVVVHNEEFSNPTRDSSARENNNYVHVETTTAQTSITTRNAFSHVSIVPKYMNVEIVINKKVGNKRITRLNTGVDSSGNPQIKYQLNGLVEKGRLSGSVKFTAQRLSNNQNVDYSYIFTEDSAYDYPPTYSKNEPYSFSNPIDITQTEKVSTSRDYPCEAKLTYYDAGTVTNPTIEETDDTIKLTISCLVGAMIRRLGVSNHVWTFPQRWGSVNTSLGDYDGAVDATSDAVTLEGTFEFYTISNVEFNIYGNTFGVDLQDETVKIGDGQHVYSFNGNELMQTSNKIFIDNYGITLVRIINYGNTADYLFTHDEKNDDLSVGDVVYYEDETALVQQTNMGEKYLETIPGGKIANTNYQPFQARVAKAQIQKNYNDIISQWKDGKEIAQIKCAMDNYYLSENRYEPYTTVSLTFWGLTGENSNPAFYNDSAVHTGDKVQLQDGKTLIVLRRATLNRMGQTTMCLVCDWENEKTTLNVGSAYRITILRATNVGVSLSSGGSKPMTIQIGEQVIPYVKKADGLDAPMSYYFDKATPKEFLVIGNGIIADGEIMQNLTLQEIPLDTKKFIILENHGDLRSGEEFSFIEVYVQQGEISVGDILEYKGETGEVTEELGENTYEVRVNTHGAFMNTKIILAKKT